MLDFVHVDFRHTRQPVPENARRCIGFLKLIGDGAPDVANPRRAERLQPQRRRRPAKRPAHRIGYPALARAAELAPYPRVAPVRPEHERVIGARLHRLPQSLPHFRPHDEGAVDRLASLHLRAGEDHHIPLPVHGGAGQGGAILGGVCPVHHHQDHRLDLQVFGTGRDAEDVEGVGRLAALLARRRLPKHPAKLRGVGYPVLIVGEAPTGADHLDPVGEGVGAKLASLPAPVEPGEVVGRQIPVEGVPAEPLDHELEYPAVQLQLPVGEPAGGMVELALIGVTVGDAPDGDSLAGPQGLGGGEIGVDGAFEGVPRFQRVLGVPVGDVIPLALVMLLPTAPDVGGQGELGEGFDRLAHSASTETAVVQRAGSIGICGLKSTSARTPHKPLMLSEVVRGQVIVKSHLNASNAGISVRVGSCGKIREKRDCCGKLVVLHYYGIGGFPCH